MQQLLYICATLISLLQKNNEVICLNAELKHYKHLLENVQMEKDNLQKTFDELVASRDAVEEAVRQVIDENASLMQELQKLRGTSLR